MRERKHFSMVRSLHVADCFTIANGVCGSLAIFQAMKFMETRDAYHLYLAFVLVVLALFFDVFDGLIARWRHSTSPMGRELDSLADVISFGVAPAAIAFAAGASSWLDQVLLLYFTACGVSRLARFNVTAESLSGTTGKVKYFEGTPIPTSVIPLGIVILGFSVGGLFQIRFFGLTLHAAALLYLLSGSLMISKTLRIAKP